MHQLFRSPVFDDERKNHQAFLLHVILWALIIVPIPYALYTIIQTPEYSSRVLTQTIIGEAVNIFLLVLLRRGHVRLACIIQVIAVWAFFTLAALMGAGVRGQAYMLGYGLVIVIAGILLGGWGALAMTLLALLTGSLMVYADVNNFLTFNVPDSSLAVWGVSAALLPVMAILHHLAAHTMRLALAQAKQEIAERKQTEAALQASEERYRIITELISDYAYAYRVEPDGSHHLEWITTDSARRMTGYDPLQEVGSTYNLYHPEDQERARQDVRQTIAGHSTSAEYRIITKAGDLRSVRIDRRPGWDPTKQRVVRFYGVAQDITERKQAEAEREALICELEVRNAELERFTYTVSHDLKSPLVTINGFLSWLEKDIQAGKIDRISVDINRISEATGKMHLLLEDLLELSRIGRLMNPPQEVPFETIVREAVAMVGGRLAGRGVTVEVAEDLPVVYGDRTRLIEVVQNLVDNATKFMSDQPEPRVEVGVRELEGDSIFFVRDNGIGIEQQYLGRIFGLFDKLDSRSEGTGIGLALVKRIIEVHGGRIWVESAGAGQGSTFLFTLPLAPDEERDSRE